MEVYRGREVVHQTTVKCGPTAIKVSNTFDKAAIDWDKGPSRIDVRDNGPYKRVVNVGKIPCKDRDHGSGIIEMNSKVGD